MTENKKSDAWKLFLFWYKQMYSTPKQDRKITKLMSLEDRQFIRGQYEHAFFWNGSLHLGVFWVLYFWGLSKNCLEEVKFIPYPVRLGCIFTVPFLSAYVFFDDIFYDEKLLNIYQKYKEEINN